MFEVRAERGVVGGGQGLAEQGEGFGLGGEIGEGPPNASHLIAMGFGLSLPERGEDGLAFAAGGLGLLHALRVAVEIRQVVEDARAQSG